jgi:formate-dependent nitrite reductase membrane component NrfD
MKHNFTKRGYIFTDKTNPRNGIMSSILGVIAVASICIAVELTYKNNGEALMQYGAAVLLAFVYSIVGLILGIRSLKEPDIFRLFPILGIVFNAVAIIATGAILYFGGF